MFVMKLFGCIHITNRNTQYHNNVIHMNSYVIPIKILTSVFMAVDKNGT